MEELDIKRGSYASIEGGKLGSLMEEIFGNVRRDGDWFISEYGAMMPIKAKAKSKTVLIIDINTIKIPDDQVMETFKRRNAFLERATGFNSKQRLKRLKEKAKKGQL